MKKTIRKQVIESAEELKRLDFSGLICWAEIRKIEGPLAFARFNKSLGEIGVSLHRKFLIDLDQKKTAR